MAVVGAIGLTEIDLVDRRAEVGYWVARRARRRGFASAALELLSSWALGPPLELGRLGVRPDVDNTASRQTALRAGYEFEAVLRSYMYAKGRRWDLAQYSLIAPERDPSDAAPGSSGCIDARTGYVNWQPMASSTHPLDPGPVAIGTWSGGRFMHFGEPLDDDRFMALITPDDVDLHDHDRRRLRDRRRGPDARPRARPAATAKRSASSAPSGTTSTRASATGQRAFPRFTDPSLRGPADYESYLRMATEQSLDRCQIDAFDLLLLHNPDRIGYTSEAVWSAMAGCATPA